MIKFQEHPWTEGRTEGRNDEWMGGRTDHIL